MHAHVTAAVCAAAAACLTLVSVVVQAVVLLAWRQGLRRFEARKAATLRARLSAAYVAMHRHIRVLRLLKERDGPHAAAAVLFRAPAEALLESAGGNVNSASSLLKIVEDLGAFWDQVMLLAEDGLLPENFFAVAGALWAIRASHFVRLAEPLDIANGLRVNGRYWRPCRYVFCEDRVAEAKRWNPNLPSVPAHAEVLRDFVAATSPEKPHK